MKSKILLVSLVVLVAPLVVCAHAVYPVSDHYDGKQFVNEDKTADAGKSLADSLRYGFSDGKQTWPDFVDDNMKPDFSKTLKAGEAAVTFINHASVVIQLENMNIIADPVFSDRVSPLSWAGPKRHRKPGAAIAELPKIDFVIVSHNHYDHMDLDSLAEIDKKDHPTFLVPLGNSQYLASMGIKNIIELDWWQTFMVGNGAKITLVPMQHWSSRTLTDKREALWGGYVIEASELKVLFSGDTAYYRQFREIQQKFGPMDVSVIPIGAYEPRWFMKDQHMNPEEAVRAHLELQSKLSIGNHFGTFQLTDEGIEDPVIALGKALATAKVNASDFVALKNGQTVMFPQSHP